MESLRKYLNSLHADEQAGFAVRCGTSIGYLRKALSKNQRFDVALAAALVRESRGAVRIEDLRPDVDWSVLRQGAAA